jgi:carboxymethylenebutenolidase
MTATAAVTAGYTLAAGPVRADVIKTDANGLTAGDGRIKVADGEMPGYFARPDGVANPPVILVAMGIFGLHEYIKQAPRQARRVRGGRIIISSRAPISPRSPIPRSYYRS